MAYSVLPGFDTVSTLVTAPRVHEYARRAIELDDRLPEPHAALCQSLGSAEWKWQEAEEACRAALTRNGSFEWAHVWLGELLAAVGRHDESRAEIDRALLLDPYSPIMYNMAAMSSLMGRDLDRAALMANRLTEFDPANGNLLGSAIDFARGDLAAARRRLDGTGPADQLDYFFAAMRDAQLRDQVGGAIESTVNRNQTNWATRTAGVLSMLGDRERALKYARIAYDRHEFSLAAFASSTMLETLHDDPRFHEILRGMNLDPSILERSRAMRVRPQN
jgi:tetratricopeptide (TPR) repeat protein